MKYEIDLPDLPDGFEYTFVTRGLPVHRSAHNGEFYSYSGAVHQWHEVTPTSCEFFILRKTAPAKLLDRIKAEYGEYDVMELDWDNRDRFLQLFRFNSLHLHTAAQSMKGFYRYVYDDDDGIFLRLEAVIDNHNEALHPVAVLFTK